MVIDGKKQRNALTAAENAVRALAGGDAKRAMANAMRAVELDQIGLYGGFAEAVTAAAGAGQTPGPDQWDAVAATLDPGPLTFLIDELRD
jgi:hypothetical protein